MRFICFISFLSAVAIFVSGGCCNSPAADGDCKLDRNDWAPDVKSNVNEFLSLYRNTPNGYVVFDFDNTSAIFDVSEQLMAYQLETMTLRKGYRKTRIGWNSLLKWEHYIGVSKIGYQQRFHTNGFCTGIPE